MLRASARLVAAFVLATTPVFADKPVKAKGKSKEHGAEVAVVFTTSEREKAQAYFVEKHGHGGCPPGLAKKNNGCLPPGIAAKRYVVGRPLPRTVVVDRVPTVLVPRLRPAPAGYEYVIVDGDLVLMRSDSRLIADAIVHAHGGTLTAHPSPLGGLLIRLEFPQWRSAS